MLCADALEQLGYQSESGPGRNEYLSAALELRYGNSNLSSSAKNTGELIKNVSAPLLFDYMAIVMDKQALAEYDFTMNVNLTDVGEKYGVRFKNGVVLAAQDDQSDDAAITIPCPKNALFGIVSHNAEIIEKAIQVEGDAELFGLITDSMNQFPISGNNCFNIIEP